MSKEVKLEALINKRIAHNALRTLNKNKGDLIDFSSNDYLGLARSKKLKALILKEYQELPTQNGSTGSRLLTGNSILVESCEERLANLFGFESSTVFSSGYMANIAFFSSVPQRGDTVIYDEYSHACIKDGCRLSTAKRLSFKHNDISDLEKKLNDATGDIFIVCEAVYSMDGDFAPLTEIVCLSKRFNAKVIVDEAHSTGIWGKQGSGLISELGLQNSIYAVIHTFGKAMGIHGASISGSSHLKKFIINFSRPFIYTTAPSDFEIISIQTAFDFLEEHPSLNLDLLNKIKAFNTQIEGFSSPSAIKSIVIGGNDRTRNLAQTFQSMGFDIRPILSPTVKEGSERLRICLHTYNTDEEIALICQKLKKAKQ